MRDDGMIAGIGFSTEQQRDMTGLEDNLRRIKDLGASHAELSLYNMDLISGGRVLTERVRRLEQICRSVDLRYTVHGPLAVNMMDVRYRPVFHKAVAATLEICGAVGASVCVQHPGFAPKPLPPTALDELHAQERAAWHSLADIAKANGTRIAIETLFAFQADRYTADPFRLADEIAGIEHKHVCGTLDFSHTYLACTHLGLDFTQAARAFAPITGHLHVHDSLGQPDLVRGFAPSENVAFGLGDLHLPLGWGDIPWQSLLPQLRFLPATVWNFELPPWFMGEAAASLTQARDLLPVIAQQVATPTPA